MQRKPRFKWGGKTERSVSEIVDEEGILRHGDILHIIERLCLLLEGRSLGNFGKRRGSIHPDSIMVDVDGDVRITNRDIPRSVMEGFLPPEAGWDDPDAPGARVYALGMLMLYMATGQKKKAESDTAVADRLMFTLIERCTAFDPNERFRDTGELLESIRLERRTGKKALTASLAIAGACLAAGLLIFFWKAGSSRGGAVGEADAFGSGYAEGYEQGFSDAPGIGISGVSFDARNGNLSGNLAAEGGPIVACSEDSVFFLMDESLFQMDPHTGATRVLATDTGAHGLHYHGGWLYYCTEGEVVRIDPKTAKREVFCASRGGELYIFDDTFYLYDGAGTGYLYRVDPDTRAVTQLNGAMEYRCLNVVDGRLYYIDPNRENCICRSDLDGGNANLISSGSYESFCVYDGRIYAATGDGLIRMDLNGGNPEILSALPAYSPNVSDGGIFYISGRGKTLEWMSLDGRMRYTVVPSSTTSFNIAGQWILYQNEEDGGSLWRVRISGADNTRLAR